MPTPTGRIPSQPNMQNIRPPLTAEQREIVRQLRYGLLSQREWYSICSAHQQVNPDCPRCQAGEMYPPPPEDRRSLKAQLFGEVYGMGEVKLSQRSGRYPR